MTQEIQATIGRVRRAMPRNPDVMAICDALEQTLITKTSDGTEKPKFDRNSYMRDYMKKRRAKK